MTTSINCPISFFVYTSTLVNFLFITLNLFFLQYTRCLLHPSGQWTNAPKCAFCSFMQWTAFRKIRDNVNKIWYYEIIKEFIISNQYLGAYNILKIQRLFSHLYFFALSAWICWFIITKLVFSIECKCVVHNDVSLFTTLLFPSLYIDIYHTWEREIIYCTLSENISRLHFITFNMHLVSCIFSAVDIGWAIFAFNTYKVPLFKEVIYFYYITYLIHYSMIKYNVYWSILNI